MSDRVATMAWNGYRHLELYYGVGGAGRVLHTINPRLHPDQVAWIVNHAEDQVLCLRHDLPAAGAGRARPLPTVRQWIAMCDADRLPADSGIPNLVSYEAWIGGQSERYAWPSFDENRASSMCYTSGTTGNPKAALYSHRSTLLHAYGSALPDVMGLSARDAVLPVVPMFHVNAWGIPYSAALTGCKLVFPGPALDGKSIYELIESEARHLRGRRAHRVADAAGPHAGQRAEVLHAQAHGDRRLGLPAGDDRRASEEYGVDVLHGWGMTEMSPLGTLCALKNKHLSHGRRGAAGRSREAGAGGIRRRHEDRRRPGRGTAVGRQGHRRPAGEGAVGRQEVLQQRGRRPAGRTAGFPPATWRPSTPMAICRSPTAART